ncbi:MAG: Pyridoxamine 5'-phosphate oxidase [Methanosaeta sp. PtaU1.Bin112]|nr:MAG: Pyridoxamine 5'-phosphate oxidase [Methanosaeta sp. PtaU1.Bin112]
MISKELMEMLDENLVYLATSTPEGKPNVVPVGLCQAINEKQLIIIDVLFNKTRKNLENNPLVALSFTDHKRMASYQLKGRAEIHADGPIFEQMLQMRAQKETRMRSRMQQGAAMTEEMKEKTERMKEWRKNLHPKAAVLITVEEIYSHMPKLDSRGTIQK